MKYQLFATTILDTLSTDSTDNQILQNGRIYQTFCTKVSSLKKAQKLATEILKKGEFKQIDCNQHTYCGSKNIFQRFAINLK